MENKKNMSSGKRSATSELNHDNWDDEVESEEAGSFSQADENTLKGRVIKKAKRRGLANQVNWSKYSLSVTQRLNHPFQVFACPERKLNQNSVI